MIMKAYQVRIYDEYYQLCDKYRKLIRTLRDYDVGELKFELNCPIELLKEQADIMKRYIDILLRIGKYEKIDLEEFDFHIERGETYGVY